MEHRDDLKTARVWDFRVISYKKRVPVGDIAANASAPTVLKPNAVILLGNILKESKDEKLLDLG